MNKYYKSQFIIGSVLAAILLISVLVFDFPCTHNKISVTEEDGQTHIYPPHYEAEAHYCKYSPDIDPITKIQRKIPLNFLDSLTAYDQLKGYFFHTYPDSLWHTSRYNYFKYFHYSTRAKKLHKSLTDSFFSVFN